jgi:deazaflavin-dependent oxidoreductase (nitroreductase family)
MEEIRMLGQILVALGVLLLGLGALLTLFVLGMRAKSPIVLGAIRLISRLFNPMSMRTAGTPGAFASIIHHRGRRTGREFATPVGAVRTDDGFVITLPYGTRAHWVRNVLAAGSATLVNEGETYEVDGVEVVPTSTVASVFSPSDQRVNRIFRVDECLRVRRAAA